MKVTVFSANPSEFAHEKRQLQEIAQVLQEDPTDKPVYMLTNVLVGKNEIDCILLTEMGPILIDCKAYKGKIYGCENGNWWVESGGKTVDIQKNLFVQAKNQRFSFLDRWNLIADKHFKKQIPKEQRAFFKVWQYFEPGSEFADDRFEIQKIRWYGIITKDTLVDTYNKLNIQYRISPFSYEKILRELGLSLQNEVSETAPVIEVTLPDNGEEETGNRDDNGDKSGNTIATPDETETVNPPYEQEADASRKKIVSIPIIIQKGPIQITIPIGPRSRPPELISAVSEAGTYLELGRLEQALNLASYALSIDKYDREAQDIKYDILYLMKRGEEAEAFIEEILRGQ